MQALTQRRESTYVKSSRLSELASVHEEDRKIQEAMQLVPGQYIVKVSETALIWNPRIPARNLTYNVYIPLHPYHIMTEQNTENVWLAIC